MARADLDWLEALSNSDIDMLEVQDREEIRSAIAELKAAREEIEASRTWVYMEDRKGFIEREFYDDHVGQVFAARAAYDLITKGSDT